MSISDNLAVSRRQVRALPGSRWLWLTLPALLFFCAFWLLPFARLLQMGMQNDRSSGNSGYWTVVSQPNYLFSLLNTVVLSVLVTLVTLAIAAIVGCFLARQRFTGRGTLLALLTFPLAFPGVVVGFLVVMLAGRQGLLAQISMSLVQERWTLAYSLTGLFIGYLYFSLPRAIVTLVAASEKLDRSLEEAARSLGASQWRITWDVIVPGLQPALLSTGALCFATSMGAFGTAFTLGTNLAVLPLTIYGEFTNYANFATAAALSVVMGAVAWLALMFARRLAHKGAV
ncbi:MULTISPECIES: ABC transporter permease [Pantoea]|uniref:ABC transporter permease n=2 Tax=Pantoea TaxID=53335 RepID=A0A0U3T9J1_9GAMM|nr:MULTISPECIES: ABC transporter permease [Pantoea]ALV91429.1 ABC transporter permease [Pantoea vagans]KHJ68634.1 ABC transporter permease [Pantoea rodasii]